MSGPGWQNSDVARSNLKFVAVLPSQDKPRLSAGETKHLVRCRMVVMEIIDAIPPLWRPAVFRKQILVNRGWIGAAGRQDRTVKQHRQSFVVRNPTIAFEPKHFRLTPLSGWRV